MQRERMAMRQGTLGATHAVAGLARLALTALALLACSGPVFAQASLTVTKYYQSNSDPDGNGQVTVGDTLTFLVRAQNTGYVTLTNVVVTDSLVTPSSTTCATLSAFQVCDLSGTYVVTAADEAAGVITNTGSATSTEVASPRTATVNTAVYLRSTAMTVYKYLQGNNDPDASGNATVGDTLTFLVRAQNTGNQPLHNVVVSDPRLTPSSITCAVLNRYQLCDLTGTTAVAVADETAGHISNTGTGTSDETGPRTATLDTVVATRRTSMTVNKYLQGNTDPDSNGLYTVGDTITYLVRAQNTGNQPLHNVVVSDPRLTPPSTTCAVLTTGQICDLTGTTTINLGDETAGHLANTGTADSDETVATTSTLDLDVTPRSASLTINKYLQSNSDPDANFLVTVGDTLSFLVRMQNTGTDPLTNVVVTDSRLTPSSITCPTVNRFGTCDLNGTMVVTPTDEANGQVVNVGSVSSNEIPGPRTVSINTAVTTRSTALSINKYFQTYADADSSGSITAGDTLTYLVRATNAGTQPLTNVVVSDSRTTPASATCATVNRSGICDLTGTYVVTPADAAAGHVDNVGSATANEITGARSASLSQPVSGATTGLLLNLTYWSNADGDANGKVTVGDVITFLARAQNTGSTVINNVAVSAPALSPASVNCPTVTAGGTCDLFGTYTVTVADEAAGVFTTTASMASTEVPGPQTSSLDTAVAPRNTALTFNTTYWTYTDNDFNGQVTVGDVITIRATATNAGSQPVTGVAVSAPALSPASLNCPTLNAGQACDLFGTYTVAVADETAGVVTFNATVTSAEVPGPIASSVNVPVQPRNSSMVLNTTYWSNNDADFNGQVTVGDTLTYRVLMQNNGSQPLTNVVVSAPLLTPASLTCTTVNAGNSCDLFATVLVTPAHESAGSIDVTGSAASNEVPGPLSSTVSTPVVVRNTALTLNSYYWTNNDADANGQVTVGDTLTFRVIATNAGNQPLTGVVVSASGITPGSLTCATLNPFASCDLFGTVVVTAADETAGAINVTGSATSNELPGPYTNPVSTPVAPSNAAMSFSFAYWTYADNDANGQVTAGDVITYRATATNTGTQPLTNVVLGTPQLAPTGLTCATVNANASCDLFATYTATAGDASAGFVTINATATSNEVPGPQTGSVTVAVRSLTPVLAIDKVFGSYTDADSNGLITAGDTIFYTVTATNVGYVLLNNIVVSDPMVTPSSSSCAALNPGNVCQLFGNHVVTVAEASAGNVTNTASAVSNETPTPVTDTLVTTVNSPTTSMGVAKALTGNADGDANGQVTAGDVLTYTVTATNTGSTTLTNLVVTDALLTPSSATCASVATGLTCVLTGTYTVTPADASAGSISNTGSATSNEIGTPVTQTLVTPVTATSTAMSVAKAVIANADGDGNGQVTAGDVLTYHVAAQNTGSTTLTNVVVNDALLTPNSTTCATVAPTSSCILAGTYTVTAADATAGNISNTGSATSSEIGTPVTQTLNTPVVAASFAMTLAKSVVGNSDPDGNGLVTAGDVLTYQARMTNTGGSTLTNVVVGDPLLTPSSQTCASVAVAGTCDLVGTYTVTPADATAGSVGNTASVTANEIATPVTASLSTPVVTATATLTVAKSITANADGDGNGQVTVGDVLTYAVVATNTGNVTLTNVVVSDPLLTPASTTCASLAPTVACTLTGTYAVAPADATAGSISNTGSATANQIAGSTAQTLVTPVVTTVATALAVVSGDQQVLSVGTASAPMVVELTSGGTPLAGETINWTTTGGTLSAASSTTDASGRTSVTVTIATSGAITVTADFAGTAGYAASSASFTHNSAIASVPQLTPEAEEVAAALDNACTELATIPNRTPEEQDLYEQCVGLTAASATDPAAVAEAVEQMLPDVAQTQTQASQAASTAQFDNLNARMNTVRSGAQGNSFAGLALVGSSGFMPLSGLGKALWADEPASTEPTPDAGGFSRWGFFASGRIGRGEADRGRTTPAYDFDINGLTAGIDYRQSDNLVLGAALGYTRQDTDLAHDEGSLDTRGWSLSGYLSWYRGHDWYLDALLSYARNDFEHRRRIVYSLPLPDGTTLVVDQVARASSDGTDTALAATFGRDFHKGGWSMSYYGRALVNRISFGSYHEELDDSAPGAGLALDVESRSFTATSSVLGARFAYAHSAGWGVLTPSFDIEWQREYNADPGAFRAVFVSDPTGTPIVVLSEPTDRSYFRIGGGLAWILTKGRSGFIYYDRMVARDGMKQDNLTLGIRIEF